MLATEETKTTTVWRDVAGVAWDRKEAAEYRSINIVLSGSNRPVIDADQLIKQLQQNPEVKAWLLQQLGVELPITQMPPGNKGNAYLPAINEATAYLLVQGLAGIIAARYEGFTSTEKLRRAMDSDPTGFIHELAKELQPHLVVLAQPQQEVDMREVFADRWLKMSTKPNKSRYDSFAIDLQEQGYRLVKA